MTRSAVAQWLEAEARARARAGEPDATRDGGRAAASKLRMVTAGVPASITLIESLIEIASLPFVEHVLALPDLHAKPGASVPSSLAIATAGTIVPEFTSAAVNDGMGIVATGLDAREMTPEAIVRFFTRVNAHTAAHRLDANRYSLSAREVCAAAIDGARALTARYGFTDRMLERMEWGGRVAVPGGVSAWSRCVPAWLRANPVGRAEMGLDFRGDHFLEVQVVDPVLDSWTAARWGLERNQVVILYHLGPFGGSIPLDDSPADGGGFARPPWPLLARLLALGARHPLRVGRLDIRRIGRSACAADSDEGLRARQALAMATNFGYAYRLATVAAIRDALHDVFSPTLRAELLCDVSHNGVVEEPWGEGTAWIARHGACRIARGGPAIIAGSHDVPSYLARATEIGPPELHSHDHGAGPLIESCRRSGRLPLAGGTTTRVTMSRGKRGRVRTVSRHPLRVSEPVDRLMTCFALNDVLQPVARLRPVGTLKH